MSDPFGDHRDPLVKAMERSAAKRYIDEAVAVERERCAQIAEAIDSGRGNEKEIARAIRSPLKTA